MTPADEVGFGVYVHWPFCAQKCPYCDFNSHVRFGGVDEPRFRTAFLTELDYTAQRLEHLTSPSPSTGEGRAGGGATPQMSWTPPTLTLPLKGGGKRLAAAGPVGLVRTENAPGPRTVSSIFFGGGTPSLMEPATPASPR